MLYIKRIVLEHPETGEEIDLVVEFYFAKAQRQTIDDPGCQEEWEIASVKDDQGHYYADEETWTDEQLIQAIQE